MVLGCRRHLAATLLWLVRSSSEEGDTSEVDCSTITSCTECLEEESCAHWTIGECMSDCLVQDAACYRDAYSFEGMSADEICTKAKNNENNSGLCSGMDDCTSCVGAVKSDGTSCMWFEDGEYCGSGCNMNGCGATACPSTNETLDGSTSTVATTAASSGSGNSSSTSATSVAQEANCSAITTCTECLKDESCAHWTAGECMSDCLVMDVACYSGNPDEVCARAENDENDSALCSGMNDCKPCVGAVKGDGVSTCMWFEVEELECCGTRCNMNGCGVTTCSDATTKSGSMRRTILTSLCTILLVSFALAYA